MQHYNRINFGSERCRQSAGAVQFDSTDFHLVYVAFGNSCQFRREIDSGFPITKRQPTTRHQKVFKEDFA